MWILYGGGRTSGLGDLEARIYPRYPRWNKQHLILPGVPGVETAYAGLHGLPPKGSYLALEGGLPLFANCLEEVFSETCIRPNCTDLCLEC